MTVYWQTLPTLVFFILCLSKKDFRQLNVRLHIPNYGLVTIALVSVILAIQTGIGYAHREVFGSTDVSLRDFFSSTPWTSLLLSPIAEEFVCRGVILALLLRRVPLVAAASVVSLIFMLLHPLPSSVLTVQYVSFPFSLILCLIARESGLLSCMLVHAAVNGLSTLFSATLYVIVGSGNFNLPVALTLYGLLVIALTLYSLRMILRRTVVSSRQM